MGEIIAGISDFWNLKKFNYAWPTEEHSALFRSFLPEDLEDELKNSSIPVKNFIFVQVVNNTLDENYWIFDLARKHSSIVGVVGWVDLSKPDEVGAIVDNLRTNPLLVGLRYITEFEDSDWLGRPEVHKSLSIIENRGLTFDLLIRPPHKSRYAAELAEKFPRLKLMIDHIGKPDIKDGKYIDEWKQHISQAAKYPNVYCKLSGLVTEADLDTWKSHDLKPYVKFCLDCFGARRCVFGSDYPVFRMANTTYEGVYTVLQECLDGCTEEEKRAIWGENAVEFYNIKVPLNY
ncbi:L-fucono-1,5-lactonase-like [Saccoglossus kowalevskii]